MAQDEIGPGLQQAAARLRAGDVAGARAAFEALLEAAPDNPLLLGELSSVLLRQRKGAEALATLKRALAAGGPPRVRLRNLSRYFVALLRRNDRQEAGRLVAEGLPDWPEGAVPEPGERTMLLSLATALLLLELPQPGLRVLGQAFPDPGEDADLLLLIGRLRLALGDSAGAVEPLTAAARLAPRKPAPLIALSAALDRAGRPAESRAATRLVAGRFPYHREPQRDGQTATILVLNPPPRQITDPAARLSRLHFRVNYPAELPRRLGDRYRFLSVLSTIGPDSRPWEADAPALVLNNLANEQELAQPGMVERIRGLVDRIGLPVINPPERVASISREENARRLAGIPGLKVPRIALYRTAEQGPEAVIADIGRTVGYPAILRPWAGHQGANTLLGKGPKSVYLVADAGEARAALAEAGWPELYAIEYLDLRKKEGWYRKIRAFFVGDEMVIQSGGFYSEWMVAGWRRNEPGIAFYRANPEALARARAMITDPAAELDAACFETLEQVRSRIGLDIFGMDFDVDDAGQVVFFEASPAMIIPHPTQGAPEDLWMPEHALQRIHAAFHALVQRRIAEGAAAAS